MEGHVPLAVDMCIGEQTLKWEDVFKVRRVRVFFVSEFGEEVLVIHKWCSHS